MNGTRRLRRGLKRASPTILTCMAAVGVIGTAVLAIRGTIKAQELVQAATDEKGEELAKLEVVKAAAPAYIPTALASISTISCVVGANTLNKRQQATMASAYAMLSQTYQRYRNAASTVYGEDADSKIQAEMAKDVYISADGISILSSELEEKSEKILFYDTNSQRYFTSSVPAVLNAMYHLNRNIVLRGDATVNEFFEFLGLDGIAGGNDLGWESDLMLEVGYLWLDFENTYTKMEDGMECCVISSCIEPKPLGCGTLGEYVPF